MKLLLLVACVAHLVRADEFVETLTSENFTSFLKTNTKTLVEFYAPWCGHCKQLAPVYEEAAKALAGEKSVGKLAKVDATVESNLAQEYGVQGYPTLKWFDNSEASDYDGGRGLSDIVGWVRSRVLPAVTTLSRKDVDKFNIDAEYVVIGYVKKGSKKEEQFDAFCDQNRGAGFIFGKVLKKKGKFRAVLRRNKLTDELDGEKELKYEGKVSKLLEWLNRNKPFLFVDREANPPKFMQSLLEDPSKGALILRVNDDEEEKKTLKTALTEAVTKLRENPIYTGLSSADDPETAFTEEVAAIYLVKPDKAEGIPKKYRLLRDSSKNFQNAGGELTGENLLNFVSLVDSGKYPRFYKTTPADTSADENVMSLDGKTFQEVAYDETKDVMVEFYAPWCGHCKQLAPLYEKFGKYVGNQYKGKDIVIAKMDATANEADDPVQGYPTLLFYPAGKHSVERRPGIKFEGDWHDQDELVDFLDEYAENLNKREL